MNSTATALKSSMEAIRSAENAVRAAFTAEVSPALLAAGGRIRLVVSLPTRTASSFSSYPRIFDAVCLQDGKVVFEYRSHNHICGAEPDLYELESVVFTELPALVAKILRAVRQNPD